MVSWGLVSGAFAFINGPISFFILRFLLGLAEAGFFPGIILYFTYWFPPSHRARIVAGFMAAIPVSIGLGAPISTAFLELDGVLGIAGWRWLFFCEAAPAVIFGIITFFYLTHRPAQADWLEAEEREWLAAEMEKERQTVEPVATSRCSSRYSIRACLRLRRSISAKPGSVSGLRCSPRRSSNSSV